jgi:hypothetical protein
MSELVMTGTGTGTDGIEATENELIELRLLLVAIYDKYGVA